MDAVNATNDTGFATGPGPIPPGGHGPTGGADTPTTPGPGQNPPLDTPAITLHAPTPTPTTPPADPAPAAGHATAGGPGAGPGPVTR
ncbi:hypothetical protein AB0O33_33020, partial [Streptomyces sp. NPDC089795]